MRKIKAAVLAALAATGLALAVAAPAQATNYQDVQFLALLESKGIQANVAGIPMAYAICADIANGYTPAQETTTVYAHTDYTMSWDLSIAFTAAAVTVYCPQFSYLGFYDSIYSYGGSQLA